MNTHMSCRCILFSYFFWAFFYSVAFFLTLSFFSLFECYGIVMTLGLSVSFVLIYTSPQSPLHPWASRVSGSLYLLVNRMKCRLNRCRLGQVSYDLAKETLAADDSVSSFDEHSCFSVEATMTKTYLNTCLYKDSFQCKDSAG